MTVILQGDLQFENMTDMRGPVAEVQRVDQPQSQNKGAQRRLTTLKFDDQERLIKQIYEDEFGTTTVTNVFRDGRLQSQTVDHHSTNRGDWQEWQRWSYDENGRLSDFRAGRDKVEWNHYLNFKYDADGRPLRYEYCDSKLGGPPVLAEISYSGKTVTLSRLDGTETSSLSRLKLLTIEIA